MENDEELEILKGPTEKTSPKFKVTVKARMYHGVLYETLTHLGMTQKKMAEYLGISINKLGGMLRMKKIPDFTSERGVRLKIKLEELTEMPVSELFPEHVFTQDFLRGQRTISITNDVSVDLLSNTSVVHQLPVPPDEMLMLAEQGSETFDKKALEEVLASLSMADREILKLKFSENLSNSEIARRLDVSERNIWPKIERALRHIRAPFRMRILSQSKEGSKDDEWLTEMFRKNPSLTKK